MSDMAWAQPLGRQAFHTVETGENLWDIAEQELIGQRTVHVPASEKKPGYSIAPEKPPTGPEITKEVRRLAKINDIEIIENRAVLKPTQRIFFDATARADFLNPGKEPSVSTEPNFSADPDWIRPQKLFVDEEPEAVKDPPEHRPPKHPLLKPPH